MDNVLIIKSPDNRRRQRKVGDPMTEGPFHITKVCHNGTLNIRRGNVIENISIRRVKPYRRRSNRARYTFKKKSKTSLELRLQAGNRPPN